MKYFFFIDIDFCRNAALLMREVLRRDPSASFCGIYGSTPNVLEDFRASLPPDFPISADIPSLDALERSWPGTGDPSRLEHFERLLGPQAVNLAHIADKYVGHGYISTGHEYDSPLKRMMRDTDDQRRYLAGMFDFLYDYFRAEKPDVLIFYAVAGAFAVACRHLAAHLGIAYRKPMSARLTDLYAMGDDEAESMPLVNECFRNFRARPELAASWRDEAAAWLAAFRSRPRGPNYQQYAVQMLSRRMPLRALLFLSLQALHPTYEPKGAQVPYPSRIVLSYFQQRWGMRHWFSGPEWRRWEHFAERDFAYYPLQYDPESTTMIFSPMFTDQVAVVEALAKSIPSTWTLAVKEHRTMMGRRPRSVYERLRRIPKVELVHPFEDQFQYIRNARLVTTITGTGGLEAVLLGKVPLFLGPTMARYLGQGSVFCPDFSRLPEAVQEALHMAPASTECLELFLAALMCKGFRLPDEFINETGGLPPENVREASAQTLADALLDSLTARGRER